MVDTNSAGTYTKTAAYNVLKDLLGIPRSALINKNFFEIFFVESDGFYLIKKPEEIIRNIFAKNGIGELNKLYFEKKMKQKIEEAADTAETILSVMKRAISSMI